MRHLLLYFACATVFLSIPQRAFAEPAEKPFVVIVKVEGKGHATIRSHTGTERIAADRDHIFINDRIHTDADSTVDILLRDGSLVRVGLNSDYLLSEEKFDPKAKTWAWVFELTKGSVRALIQKSQNLRNVKFKINTPSATIGVRGTQFIVEYFPVEKLTSLYTIEGTVFFGVRGCDLRDSCVDVAKGKKSKLRENEVTGPSKPESYSEKELLGGTSSRGASGEGSSSVANLGNEQSEADIRKALLEGAGKLDQSGKSAGETDTASADAIIKEGMALFKNEQNVLLGLPQELSEPKLNTNSLTAPSAAVSDSNRSQLPTTNPTSQQQISNAGGAAGSLSGSATRGSTQSSSGSNTDGSTSIGAATNSSNGGSASASGSISEASQSRRTSTGGATSMSAGSSGLSSGALSAINCIYTNCPISQSHTSISTSTGTSTSMRTSTSQDAGGGSSKVPLACSKSVCTSTFVCKDPTPPAPGGICNDPGSVSSCVKTPVACATERPPN